MELSRAISVSLILSCSTLYDRPKKKIKRGGGQKTNFELSLSIFVTRK